MYAIKRINQQGGYVSKPGSKYSYTFDIKNAQKFSTKEQAEKNLCVENEIIVNVLNEIY